jgi:bud site selection protein 20
MGGIQRRKKTTAKNKFFHRKLKTKHYMKDIDQLWEDSKPENSEKLKNQAPDEELPGLGQFYCISCGRHFTGMSALEVHKSTKMHKKMLKKLKETPHTQKDAELYGKF